jgi:transcriptional regulator GlxA family with amidase domain
MAAMTSSVQILPKRAASSRPRHIVFVAVSPIQVLDLIGPYEIFDRVRREGMAQGYRLSVVHTGRLRASCGLSFGPAQHYRNLKGVADTLLVVGGDGVERADYPPDLVKWIRRRARHSRRVGSICTGAFLLGAAGLLDGRRAVTHWGYCRELARRYQRISVELEPIFIRDGNVYTTAGVTAGIDLALALVEEDFGVAISRRIAKDLVLYLRRSGNQAQFSTLLALQTSDRKPIEEVIAWMNDHLDERIAVEQLAERAAMSPRHFARVFAAETGHPPGKHLELLRVEAARRMLETSQLSVKQISAGCGFADPSSLRRAFAKCLQVGPQTYRERFRR